jgi:hypothetical protein
MKLVDQPNVVCIDWLSLDTISGLYAFDYSVDWLAQDQRFPLSPVLPLVNESLPAEQHSANIRQFFQNLLPEGQALDDTLPSPMPLAVNPIALSPQRLDRKTRSRLNVFSCKVEPFL